MAPGRSQSHLLPAHENTPQKHSMYENDVAVDSGPCLFGVLAYLIVSQCVESFPVIVDLSCDIFILQNDSGHPTLTPFFEKREQRFRRRTQPCSQSHLAVRSDLTFHFEGINWHNLDTFTVCGLCTTVQSMLCFLYWFVFSLFAVNFFECFSIYIFTENCENPYF